MCALHTFFIILSKSMLNLKRDFENLIIDISQSLTKNVQVIAIKSTGTRAYNIK